MIEYFTALVISYTLKGVEVEANVWFETHHECQQVMQDDLADPIYDYLLTLYGRDIMMRCIMSDQVSYEAIRPKLRPQQLETFN